jgi:hypothetical protein
MIINNANVNKLHDEFRQAGINPYPVFELENGDGEFTFPAGTDMDLVQQIIDAHDPTPSPSQPNDKERIEALEIAMLDIVLGGVE